MVFVDDESQATADSLERKINKMFHKISHASSVNLSQQEIQDLVDALTNLKMESLRLKKVNETRQKQVMFNFSRSRLIGNQLCNLSPNFYYKDSDTVKLLIEV
jgi:hypothetical protein